MRRLSREYAALRSREVGNKLNKTLENLPNFKCPTVMRITSVRSLNMRSIEGYAGLIRKAQPTYIEAKAYMHVGFSRQRLGYKIR